MNDELRKLAAKAELPWGSGAIPSDSLWVPRWQFVHAAVNALPALLDDNDRLAARVAALEEALALVPDPELIPWFMHCGISHAEGAKCLVCRLLAAEEGQ